MRKNAVEEVVAKGKAGTVTVVFGWKEKLNNAAALKEYIEARF